MEAVAMIVAVCSGILVPLLIAIVAWAIKINANLAAISENLKSLPELWKKSNHHARQLARQRAAIARLHGRLNMQHEEEVEEDEDDADI